MLQMAFLKANSMINHKYIIAVATLTFIVALSKEIRRTLCYFQRYLSKMKAVVRLLIKIIVLQHHTIPVNAPET